jgi:undecaprenyl diphosphate synthase
MKTSNLIIPNHIAIIMDGNRRWARSKNLPDIEGHKEGTEALEQIVEAASKLGVKMITVYALSTENLQERAKRELSGLFDLMRSGYQTKIKKMMKNGVGISVLGEVDGLPGAIKRIVDQLRKTYIKNESIRLNIALNYGGKREVVEAFKDMIKDGIDLNKVDDKIVDKYLYTKGEPDPELVIRTGGRIRLSNFLLWQTAYSELYFTKVLWPDFNAKELEKAVKWYSNQKRNFGK